MKLRIFLSVCTVFIVLAIFWADSYKIALADGDFDFKGQLFGEPGTLFLWVVNIDTNTGKADLNGVDTQSMVGPLTWNWGDGTIYDGWFPQSHTYSNITKNYIVKVTSHYAGEKTDLAEALIRFVSPAFNPISLPTDIAVKIPGYNVALTSRMPDYGIPDTLTHFENSQFGLVPRSTVEYILSVAAWIQKDFANNNVYLINGNFQQYLLRDPTFGGMYSLWYTSPVCFGVADYGFQGSIQYSSFMHEMGHNFTLNSPASYYYGGKIDGNANAIFSETMAQIFQHATAYEIVNNFNALGLSEDIALEIKQNAISSIKLIKSSYENYINSGKKFSSWNNLATQEDETFNTFMTIAYKFCTYAENQGLGYKIPLKKMMRLLQTFDGSLRQKYDQYNNNLAADTFRATLMITALSYAFSTDLRTEFRNLNFPISDQIYGELMNKVNEVQDYKIQMKAGWNLISFPVNKCFYEESKPDGQPNCMKFVDIIKDLGFNSLSEWFSSVIKPNDAWQMVIGNEGVVDRSLPSQYHSMKYMSSSSGYWVNIDKGINNAELTLSDSLFPTGSSIPVKTGWNLISCPRDKGYYDKEPHPDIPWITDRKIVNPPVSNYVFDSIKNKYSMIIGENGAYNPSLLPAFNSLHYIAYGHGYWIRMNEDEDLVYPQ